MQSNQIYISKFHPCLCNCVCDFLSAFLCHVFPTKYFKSASFLAYCRQNSNLFSSLSRQSLKTPWRLFSRLPMDALDKSPSFSENCALLPQQLYDKHMCASSRSFSLAAAAMLVQALACAPSGVARPPSRLFTRPAYQILLASLQRATITLLRLIQWFSQPDFFPSKMLILSKTMLVKAAHKTRIWETNLKHIIQF